MDDTFGATFSGPDMVALTAAVLEVAPYTRGMPTEMDHKLATIPTTADWKDRMLAPEVDDLAVTWGPGQRISRSVAAIGAGFPSVPLEPTRILDFAAPLPFELAVVPPVHDWMDDYFAPAISAYHALLGWCALLKGAGHERWMASRRWVEHGPWRTYTGPNDTTLIEFHELEVEPEVSMPQAEAAHDWMTAGFLRSDHRYANDIEGIYTQEDGLLRIIADERAMSDALLLDACVARRDRREDPEKPLSNIAFVFMDEAVAREHLDALWLRGLECLTLRDGKEVRLDERHTVKRKQGWW